MVGWLHHPEDTAEGGYIFLEGENMWQIRGEMFGAVPEEFPSLVFHDSGCAWNSHRWPGSPPVYHRHITMNRYRCLGP